jgi:uncharacterized membrane protein YphA (DoxX/SURF4 family)
MTAATITRTGSPAVAGAPAGRRGAEPAAVYSWVLLLLVAIGPGRCALDSLRHR